MFHLATGVAAGDAREGDEALLLPNAAEARMRRDVAGRERVVHRALQRLVRRAGELLGARQVPLARRILPRSQAGGAMPRDVRESRVQRLGRHKHMRVEEGGPESSLPLHIERPHRARQVLGRRDQGYPANPLRGVQRKPRQIGQDVEGFGAGPEPERHRAIAD